ncbi:Ankyrin repeat-containing protein [Cladophialophora immunda]|nr:Ankyrin repeat-containing protein [Cladophialophora immunda]
MDPLSFTASLIALIGAANAASQGLQKLIRLRGVPDVILALNNEVSDLQLLLHEVNSLFSEARSVHAENRGSTAPKIAGFQSLPPILEHIQAKLNDLDTILKKLPANGLKFTSKVLWLRVESNVFKIRNELGTLKHNLNTALGILTSSTALRVQVELRDLRVTTSHGQLGFSQVVAKQHSSLEKSLATILKYHDNNEGRFDKIEQGLLSLSEQVQQQQPPVIPVASHAPTPWANQEQKPPIATSGFGALQMRFSQRTRSLSPACDSNVCKGNSEGLLHVHYFFPPWFLAKVASIALSISRANGPELCLRVANVRPEWDPIFKDCYFGDVEAVRSSLVAGKASVLDVNASNGNSLLHLAMYKSQLEVVELLIQFGAEPHAENYTRESPYDMAWNSILCFQGTSNSSKWKIDQLLKIYPNEDACVGRRKLNQLHKVVMNMLHIDLKQEVLQHPTLIDQPDADGRTPLHWAAARGNSEAVRTLLEHGASPNKTDFIMQGPLRSSLKADGPECMELLLQAGARVDQRDTWGQTCLIAAMYYSYPEFFIPALLSCGANVNASDYSGQSPIFEAVRNNHTSAVRILIRHGARINSAADNNGTTPLQGGVTNNSHDSVSELLTHKFDTGALDKAGRSVLHYAALFADVPMLRLLACARMYGLDPTVRDKQGHMAAELAHQRIEGQRAEMNEARMTQDELVNWEIAFAELLLSVTVPSRVDTRLARMEHEAEKSDSEDTTSFHSTIDHFAELGIV